MENPVIKLLLQSEQAEVPTRKNKQLKSIAVDGRRHLYNKSKPVSKILNKKLQSVRNTQEYKSFANEKVRTTILKKRLDNALKTYVMKNRVKTTRVQKAFKSYANSFTLANEHYAPLWFGKSTDPAAQTHFWSLLTRCVTFRVALDDHRHHHHHHHHQLHPSPASLAPQLSSTLHTSYLYSFIVSQSLRANDSE